MPAKLRGARSRSRRNCVSATASCYDGDVTAPSDSLISAAPARADELSERGVQLLGAGNAVEAVQAFRDAISVDSEHVEAHHGLIRALCDAEQFEAAVAAALALTVLTPQDPLAHTSLSIALQKGGHIPEAEAAAGRARILEWKQQLAMEPGDSERSATNL
jgi:thioredoxin-like negative regulator of GroEL